MSADCFYNISAFQKTWHTFQKQQDRFISVTKISGIFLRFIKRLLNPVPHKIFSISIFNHIAVSLAEIMCKTSNKQIFCSKFKLSVHWRLFVIFHKAFCKPQSLCNNHQSMYAQSALPVPMKSCRSRRFPEIMFIHPVTQSASFICIFHNIGNHLIYRLLYSFNAEFLIFTDWIIFFKNTYQKINLTKQFFFFLLFHIQFLSQN